MALDYVSFLSTLVSHLSIIVPVICIHSPPTIYNCSNEQHCLLTQTEHLQDQVNNLTPSEYVSDLGVDSKLEMEQNNERAKSEK